MAPASDDPRLATESAIVAQGAVPVLRMSDPDLAYSACARLTASGLSVVELTATTPGWQHLLREAVRDNPSAVIGMGTISTPEDAAAACDAGARFLVTPFPVAGAEQVAEDHGILLISGGFTPAEVAAASQAGLCKLFPAHLGGIAYLKTLLAILPHARIMPTGGVAIGSVADWLTAGAAAVGVGSDLVQAVDLDAAVAELARQVSTGRTR